LKFSSIHANRKSLGFADFLMRHPAAMQQFRASRVNLTHLRRIQKNSRHRPLLEKQETENNRLRDEV